ncbi:MAG: short-chain fatty acyl-CoA regulator family protein [Pseudomonadota bacterium]
MAKESAVYLGPKLKRLRRDLGLTQSDMAEELGISASYVALMEGNQRPVTADMLLRLAAAFKIDMAALAGGRADETVDALETVLRDPLFAEIDLAPMEARDAAHAHPSLVEAVLRLHAAYREGQLALADDAGSAESAQDPVGEARRFLAARRNSFPTLDDFGERLAADVAASGGFETYLSEKHRLYVRRLPFDIMAGAVRRFDVHKQELLLSETLDRASHNFQLALQIAYLDMRELVADAVDEGVFETDNGAPLARRALANYAAATILMPYGEFVRLAEKRRYDLEVLARRFTVSFEQVAHRLTTLQKPGQEGVPFFFTRVDAAGNVSKRLDGAGFPFARHGGSCPLWSLHEAFGRPREIIAQWVELPDGERFFSIARTVTAGGGAYGASSIRRAIALGCAEKHASRLIYADGREMSREAPTPIGVTCRLCHRADCTARAEPPLGRQVLLDDYRRMAAPYGFGD